MNKIIKGRKIPITISDNIIKLMIKQAEERHITLQELIRAVIVGEWIEKHDST